MTDRSGFCLGKALTAFPGKGGLTAVTASASQSCASNTAYIANSASALTFTLPASPAIGDLVQVVGLGAGGFVVSKNTGQSLYDPVSSGTSPMSSFTGGAKTAITLRYIAAGAWLVIAARGPLTGTP